MSDMESVMAGLLSSGKLNKNDKRWFSAQINKIQAHESQMAMMKWLAEDPEAKYYAGVVLGSATAVAGAIVSGDFTLPGTDISIGGGVEGTYAPGTKKTPSEFKVISEEEGFDPKGWIHSKKFGVWTYVPEGYAMNTRTGEIKTVEETQKLKNLPWWAAGPTGMVAGYAFLSDEEKEAAGFPTADSIMGVFNNAFSMVGAGFAGFCAAVLVLKAIFGEDGLSQLPFSGGVL